jgi:5-methylcytosine-specific restriction enzyme subunit McrC
MIRRTLLEWQSLPYGDDDNQIPTWAADRLARVAARSKLAGNAGSRVLEHGRHSLGARQVVGVIVAKDCALEILPKIDIQNGSNEGEGKGLLRDKLVHMLAVAFDLEIDAGAITGLGWQRENLLEVLIKLFTDKLSDALRQGMPRRYVAHDDDLASLRGKLDVTRQFTVLAASPQRLACRFDELSPDIPLNQIMKATVERLLKVSASRENQRRLTELNFAYADISRINTHSIQWENIHLDRTNSRWRDLINLARLLIGNRFQTSSMGEHEGFSLLFEMNTLFEQFIGRMLKRFYAGKGFSVGLQGGRLYCLEDEQDGRKTFQTRPDILIRDGTDVVHIVDTKWKRISAKIDDPKQGVSQSDVYQMMAYGQVYGCSSLTLIYPHNFTLKVPAGVLSSHIVGTSGQRLYTASVDLNDLKGLKGQLSQLSLPIALPGAHISS